MNRKYVAVLLLLMAISCHLYVDFYISTKDGWVVYPPLSALPKDFKLQSFNYNTIRILSIVEGLSLAGMIFIILRKKK